MNKTVFVRLVALIATYCFLALPGASMAQDRVLFVGDTASFSGNYVVADRSMSVVIDGLHYRGNFSDTTSDSGSTAVTGPRSGGVWGRAFLFASSAKVLQCALDSNFPKVSGRCQDSDGRIFRLTPAL